MSYTIRHLGLGGILDQAIAVVRNHFVLLFTIVAILLLPILLIQHFLHFASMPDLPPHPTMEDYARAHRATAAYLPWTFGISVLYLVVLIPVANAAVIQAVARVYLGQPVTAMEAIGHGLRRLPAIIGTGILVYLVVFVGFILFIIPGIYFSIWYGLSQHVVVIEGLAGTTAMKRSKRLVHKDRGTFLALAVITFVIAVLVGGGTNFIRQPHLQVVSASLAQALLTMFSTASFVIFYFSCRCHVENFDLHYLAQSIGAEPVGEPEAAPAPTTY